jgi:tetratricopeptide (TPR) repeat protein
MATVRSTGGSAFLHRRLRPAAPLALALLLAAVVLAAPGFGAEKAATQKAGIEKVGVETGRHDGLGRVVFAWPDAVKFEAHLDDKGIVVAFERPFSADLARIVKQLPTYVERATMEGANTVVITPKHAVGLHSFAIGNRIAIDLLDKPPEKTPETPPAAKAEKVAEPAPAHTAAAATAKSTDGASPAVPVKRVAEAGLRRLVFEWPRHVDFTAKVAKGEAHIHFRQAAAIDADQLAAAVDLKPEIAAGKDEVTVLLKLPNGTRLRAYRRDNAVIIDVAGSTLSKPVAVAARPVEAASLREAAPPAATPPVVAFPAEKLPAEKAIAEQSPTEKATAEKPPGEKQSVRTAATETPVAAAVKEPAAPEVKAAPSVTAPIVAAPAPSVAAAAPPARDPGPLSLLYASGDAGATLRFEWNKPVDAAIFRRGAYLWIVFSAPIPVDLADLRAKGKVAVTAVQQIPHPTATILRLTTLKGFNPSIRRADTAWIVELTPQILQPGAPIGVSLQPAASPPRAFFTVREPGAPIVFQDPEIGDSLTIVPVSQVGQGVAREERLVDFTALLTAQGIALRPLNDTVVARAMPTGVEVTSRSGLILSNESDRGLRRSEAQPRLFDLADWFGPRDGDVLARRRALQQDIVAAAPVSRSGARLDLARFYFAHGYGPETLGVLEAIQRDDPSFAADPHVRALAGGAMLLDDDLDGAAHELSLHALDDEQDVALWRGSLAVARRDWSGAAAEFARGEALLPSYPKVLRNRLALEAAEAMLTTGQPEDANRYLDLVLKDAPNAHDRAAAQLLTARALELAGEGERARAILDKLAAGDDRPTRARAIMTRTLADLDSGAVTRGEAIETLDGLRFAWRGDDFELNLLRRLGELKLKDGDYRGGLEALHQAMTNFPDHPDHRAIGQEIAEAFSDLFVGADAENVPPLKALALYDEYHDLTPAGPKGDAIIARLVDRLVGVDLLDRAATLLENQVQFRLTGKDKTRVATRLALVQLLDRKPTAALATLDGGGKGGDPARDGDPNLARQRQQLRARALLELHRADEALAILGADNSVEADQLRADIYWRGKNWDEAAKTFARLAGAARVREGQLDEEQARTILNWGTALTLAGDQAGIARLAATYGLAMDASPFRDAFRVIASGGTAPSGDIRQLAGKVAQVADLQGFMASYRERLAKQKLSAIN